jgi:uncharacterized protein
MIVLAGYSLISYAQTKPVKILFDVTSKDSLTHQAVLRHVKTMSSAYTNSNFEVVVYGGALTMLLKDQSTVSDAIQSVSANKNVTFAVCGETMRRQNIDKSQLISGVIIVPDAIMEIVTKQGEGWGYIKEAHH